jgi:hypothetical protein
MMPLSSHLRLEVLQESMEDVNLRRDILFILLPVVFQATRSTSRTLHGNALYAYGQEITDNLSPVNGSTKCGM